MSPPHPRDSSPDDVGDGSDDDKVQHESFSRSSQAVIMCLRPWTPAVTYIPLPQKAIALQRKCQRNYKRRRDEIKDKERVIKQRLQKAMLGQLREMWNKDYEKLSRHGSDQHTKVPPQGYWAILDRYCLVDNPNSCDYVMPTVTKMLLVWRNNSKKIMEITVDWKRIHEL
ncbi:uncharacterized protein A4U43_C04F20150 [Asparagus officinalis]|uniref:Uncharacterized protein n=1 Tax=Asparagus officinalis TaxID=4686 RepID=A0A5P1F2D1_ASPOF|nr:uncharacterized protein A4U43_C04F20150 [Asparagus officinalis]